MACAVPGGTVVGIVEDISSGVTTNVYEQTTGIKIITNVAVHDSLACMVINIAANNGNYTFSSSVAPFKFQWADVSTKVTTTASIPSYLINITTIQTIAVSSESVIPVYDDSASRWVDLFAKYVTDSDLLATREMDSSSDGELAAPAAVGSVVSISSTAQKRTIVTVATADYILCGKTLSKPAILVAGCQGSAVNDATSGVLVGP